MYFDLSNLILLIYLYEFNIELDCHIVLTNTYKKLHTRRGYMLGIHIINIT